MKFGEFKEAVEAIAVGKHVRDAVYLHESAVHLIGEPLLTFLQSKLDDLGLESEPWSILKVNKRKFGFSLLNYPTFFEDAYPPLEKSCTVDLVSESIRRTNYGRNGNPPILHRRETFLDPEHPKVAEFAVFTQEGEEAGLYENPCLIGYKKAWEKLIAQKGYILDESGHIVPQQKAPDESTAQEVFRHKTAINRYALSKPMQILEQQGFLDGSYSLFDYGCGKGDDLAILKANHLKASGWDPSFAPNQPIQSADIVNLGFVINVIERPKERLEALKRAFSLAQKFLVVSAMLGGEKLKQQFRSFGDGIITSRNTFQKYYSQRELREYLENGLQEQPIAVAPGVFFVFKDKHAEQHFLANAGRRRISSELALRLPDGFRQKRRRQDVFQTHPELMERFWLRCLDLGRLPKEYEFDESAAIKQCCGTLRKALRLACDRFGYELFEQTAAKRREDLLVFVARNHAYKMVYKSLEPQLKADLSHFFGSYKRAKEEAWELLQKLVHTDLIEQACNEARESLGFGHLEPGKAYTIHRSYIPELPILLRLYIACSKMIYGELNNIDLIKVHMHSGKVSLMIYDDFEGKRLPLLIERIKVKLRKFDMDIFHYSHESNFKPHPLYIKSRYIGDDFQEYVEQKSFDTELEDKLGTMLEGFGPTLDSLALFGFAAQF